MVANTKSLKFSRKNDMIRTL